MKKYLIALSALAFATTSCYEKLNIAPPNRITNDQIQELLKSGEITKLSGGRYTAYVWSGEEML